MHSRRDVLRNFNVLNLLLAAAVIGFFIHFLGPLLETPTSAEVPKPREIALELPSTADEPAKPPIADYALIGEQNLFHPDRAVPEGKKPPVSPQPRPELVLHGTMITGELKIAYLADKKAAQKTPGRSAPHIVVKEGDPVSGYVLRQITETMVVLANGEEQMTLYLDELKDRKGEITGPTRAPSQPATAPTQAMPRPSMPPQQVQRPPAMQPAPPASPSTSRRPPSQPASTMTPAGQPRQPAMQYFPPVPPAPVPIPPVMNRP
ncbi:MAG: hypothetical protein AB1558_01000 [Thermodesulfobacteriota bacterium]